MNNAIRTENLVKRFRKVEALSGLDLTVPEGSIYAFVGPNGAGKTTAIKILMNIVGATRGRAEVLGLDSMQLAGRHFASIGYVSENQELPEWMRVDAFLAYLRPFYLTWDRTLENDLVSQFDLPLDRKLKDLSRGMRMKAALAGALAFHPKLMVLDEPFTGLDRIAAEALSRLLARHAAAGRATVLVTHNVEEGTGLATHVAFMRAGRFVHFAPRAGRGPEQVGEDYRNAIA